MDENYEYERRKYEYLVFQRNKIYLLYGIVFTVTGLVILLTKELILNFIDSKFSISFVVVGTVIFAFGAGLLLYRYLQSGLAKPSISSFESDNSLRNELEELRFEVMRLRRKSSSVNNSENLNEMINSIIDNTLTEEFISNKINNAFREQAIENSRIRQFYKDFENLSYRVDSELSRLRRSANLNLVIGTLTTTMAIIALGYEVFKTDLNFNDTVALLSHYVPRLSLVIFIEIFAFFFLKLYKANLQDIKYYNNEKTNIDFKIISLKTAINIDDKDLLKLAIEELIKTERNFKLGKGESTVEIEKLRNERENNKLLSQILSKLSDKL